MEIYVNGSKISLSQKDFVIKGGEGKIFKRGNTAYKIYEDLTKMIPPAKIRDLETLEDPKILKPKDLITNSKKQNVGFTMNWMEDHIALYQLFTNSFRENNSIENDMVIQLVENMKHLIQYVHSKKCLIVDINELNCLVNNNFITPYLINVNAWQTPRYGATTIMPSIRDWSTDTFSELTDWFSFAVISFQLFIGMHPFKGKHRGYRKNDFVNRVRDSVSVFNSSVTLSSTTRDFNLIPDAYKDWYYRIFENGDRFGPPVTPGDTHPFPVVDKLVPNTSSCEIKLIFEVDDKIIYHHPDLNITKTKDKIYLGKTNYKISQGDEIIFTPLERLPILVKIINDQVQFKLLPIGFNLKPISLTASDMMIVDNHLYLKNKEKLIEVDFKIINQTVLPSIKTVCKLEALSSKLYSNVVYQNILGKAYLCIPNQSAQNYYIKAIPELNDFKIIEVKYQNKVCMLIVYYKNKYHRIVLIFNNKHDQYTYQIINDVDYVTLNFIVLDNGICINITEDDIIKIFPNQIDKTYIKSIEDPNINNTMKLCKDGINIKFYKDNKVYSMKMK